MIAAAPVRGVDRSSARWQRIRAACGNASANNIDLDEHADLVWLTVESFAQASLPKERP